MKRELITKDGKMVGIKKVYETGDKYWKEFGDYDFLREEPTSSDYEHLTNKVLDMVFKHIKESEKKWNYESCAIILKPKEAYEDYLFPPDKTCTLGVKVAISRIVEEGENL